MDGMDLVIIVNPNRITGRAVGEDALLKIMSAAAGKNIRICLDESLMDFAADQHSFSPGNQHLDILIILRTTAFFYGLPGLEVAYGIAHPLIAGAVQGLQSSPPGILSVEAALTAFKDAVYSREVRDFMGSEKAWFMRSIRKIERVTCFDSDANVFLLRTEGPSEALVNFLGRSGFFIRHCGDIIGLGPDFLRCSVIRHDKAVKFLRLLKGRLQNVRVAD